ncbi:MAG: EF-P lysine aminoacylase GenX [Alphaproteobacteria bacterium]|nr:EF-P lysine aminoacylase GenX [Alphaproteobacteria bacterium]
MQSKYAQKWWTPERFLRKKPLLEQRMALLRAVRGWFEGGGFWEVETPILQTCPVMDAHIHGFATDLKDRNLAKVKTMYLHTSPEFAMKKLLVAGVEKPYQICHVFRNGDDSPKHSPEFTLVEWYRASTDYKAMMDDCIHMLRHAAEKLGIFEYKYKTLAANPFLAWNMISVAEAFDKYAQINLDECLEDNVEALRTAARKAGVSVRDDDRWDEIFFAVMQEKIEPHLGIGTPAILYDYPLSLASLSKHKGRYAERFEVYVCGLELANAFTELTDAAEQRKRFEAEMAFKQQIYGESYPVDEDFIDALEYGMPPASGCALGFDRLAMLAADAKDIDEILWAPV